MNQLTLLGSFEQTRRTDRKGKQLSLTTAQWRFRIRDWGKKRQRLLCQWQILNEINPSCLCRLRSLLSHSIFSAVSLPCQRPSSRRGDPAFQDTSAQPFDLSLVASNSHGCRWLNHEPPPLHGWLIRKTERINEFHKSNALFSRNALFIAKKSISKTHSLHYIYRIPQELQLEIMDITLKHGRPVSFQMPYCKPS